MGGQAVIRLQIYKGSAFVSKHGQTHEEGRHHWQVRNSLRRLSAQDDQEDGDYAARKIHLFFLRQGGHETLCDRHLGLQELQEGGSGRRVCLQHDRGRYRAQCSATSARNEGDIELNKCPCLLL